MHCLDSKWSVDPTAATLSRCNVALSERNRTQPDLPLGVRCVGPQQAERAHCASDGRSPDPAVQAPRRQCPDEFVENHTRRRTRPPLALLDRTSRPTRDPPLRTHSPTSRDARASGEFSRGQNSSIVRPPEYGRTSVVPRRTPSGAIDRTLAVHISALKSDMVGVPRASGSPGGFVRRSWICLADLDICRPSPMSIGTTHRA